MPFGFGFFSIIFFLVFFLVLSMIVITFFRGIKQWKKNNDSPRLTVEAKVATKRSNFYRNAGTDHHVGTGHTTYYITFEVQSGDRMELNVPGQEYGLLVEGDWGSLTFQGTRYLSFQRKRVPNDDL